MSSPSRLMSHHHICGDGDVGSMRDAILNNPDLELQVMLEYLAMKRGTQKSLKDPHIIETRSSFRWGLYPEVERLLLDSADEFYRQTRLSLLHQPERSFCNRLVRQIRPIATQEGYTQLSHYTDQDLRGRILRFYKTLQSQFRKQTERVQRNTEFARVLEQSFTRAYSKLQANFRASLVPAQSVVVPALVPEFPVREVTIISGQSDSLSVMTPLPPQQQQPPPPSPHREHAADAALVSPDYNKELTKCSDESPQCSLGVQPVSLESPSRSSALGGGQELEGVVPDYSETKVNGLKPPPPSASRQLVKKGDSPADRAGCGDDSPQCSHKVKRVSLLSSSFSKEGGGQSWQEEGVPSSEGVEASRLKKPLEPKPSTTRLREETIHLSDDNGEKTSCSDDISKHSRTVMQLRLKKYSLQLGKEQDCVPPSGGEVSLLKIPPSPRDSRQRVQEFKTSNPVMTFGQLAYTSAMYSEFPPSENEAWGELASDTPPAGYDAEGGAIVSPAPTKDTRKGKPEKDVNFPKRYISAYLFYQNAIREPFTRENPGIPFGQVSTYISNMYKNLTRKEKAPWESLAQQDRTRYDAEVSAYVPPPGYDERGFLIEDLRLHKSSKKGPRVPAAPKKRVPRDPATPKWAPRDPDTPKRASTAYAFFTKEMRPRVVSEFPGIFFGDVGAFGKVVGERWRAMTPDGKKPYEEMAKQDKTRFQMEMQTYTANQTTPELFEPSGAESTKACRESLAKRSKSNEDDSDRIESVRTSHSHVPMYGAESRMKCDGSTSTPRTKSVGANTTTNESPVAGTIGEVAPTKLNPDLLPVPPLSAQTETLHALIQVRMAAGSYRSAINLCHNTLKRLYGDAQEQLKTLPDSAGSLRLTRDQIAELWCLYARTLLDLGASKDRPLVEPTLCPDFCRDQAISALLAALSCPLAGNHAFVSIYAGRLSIASSLQRGKPTANTIAATRMALDLAVDGIDRAHARTVCKRRFDLSGSSLNKLKKAANPFSCIVDLEMEEYSSSFSSLLALPTSLIIDSSSYAFVDMDSASILCHESNRLSRFNQKLLQDSSVYVFASGPSPTCLLQCLLEELPDFQALDCHPAVHSRKRPYLS